MECQLGKVSWFPPTLPQGLSLEPRDHPHHIHGGSIEQLVEVRARQADVPTPVEIAAPNSLGKATLVDTTMGQHRLIPQQRR
jgi:hypothetical protein